MSQDVFGAGDGRAAEQTPVQERGRTWVRAEHVISVAGMPLPQWQVARVSDAQTVLMPLHGAQRRAAWQVAAGLGALALLAAPEGESDE